MGDLRNGKEAGVPLWDCSNSASSRAKDLGNGTGAVLGGVKPVDDPGGLDRVRAEGRAPPGTPAALEKEELCLCISPNRVFEKEGLLDRVTFELLRIAPVN